MSVSVPIGSGCNFPHQMAEDYGMDYGAALATIKPGWFLDCKHKPELFDAYDNYYGHVWQCDMDWYEAAIPDIEKYQDRLWFFGNEPNVDGMAVVTPAECARTLNQVRKDFPNLKIAAPSVFRSYMGWGRDWTQAYLDAGGPLPDYWSYDDYEPNKGQVFSRIDSWQETFGDSIPIIVKEGGSWLERRERITEVIDAFRTACDTGRIRAWAHFSARYELDMQHLNLLNRDGSTTWVGKFYINTISASGSAHTVYLPNVTRGQD